MYNELIMDELGEWYEQDLPLVTNDILSNGYHYSIWIAPHIKDPKNKVVIKVYYGKFEYNNINIRYLKDSEMCRIRIDEPEYANFPDEDLILSKELKERFISLVNNSWSEAIEYMNDVTNNSIPINTPIPDYSKLETAD